MSNFSNYKKFENVGIRSSNDTLIIMNSSNNNISLHSSDGGDDNVDTLSIKNIINKTPNEDLNLSSLNGTTINPVIKINNNHSDCRIMTNLNVYGNVNINNNLIIPNYNTNSSLLSNTYGSIYYNTTENKYKGYTNEGWISLGLSETNDTTIHKNLNVSGNINLTNGEMIQTSGIGSFGSINSGVGTFKNLNISGNLNLPVGMTSSRPSNPSFGTIRFNSETSVFEGYSGFDGGVWINLTEPPEVTPFIELVLVGGGGGGGDCGIVGGVGPTNGGGGGGGGGGLIEASGSFPLNVPFILQIGGGGRGPIAQNNKGNKGHVTRLTSDGFDLKAYGGGGGASAYHDAEGAWMYAGTGGGSGGGGSGGENSTPRPGAQAGPLGEITTNDIITDLQITKRGGNGTNYNASTGIAGHGGGAIGTTTDGAEWGQEGYDPVGKTSGVLLWPSGGLKWSTGGLGARAQYPHAGNNYGSGVKYMGSGGAGSHNQVGHAQQNGEIGGAIINVPAGISISITGSNNNMVTENATVNGGTSYIFYDNRFNSAFNTGAGETSGSFTIIFRLA